MRLIEINDKIKATRIPVLVYNELMANEVDTIDSSSPDAKRVLGDELRRATLHGNIFKIPMSADSQRYLRDVAVPDLIRKAYRAVDQRRIRILQKFQAQLNAKLHKAE